MSITDQALADRESSCNVPRIPTGRFPVYATTLRSTVAIGDTQASFEFEAERDTLFTTLSVEVGALDLAEPGRMIGLSAEYCNTKYMQRSDVRQWAGCCDRKPVFLVGVRENKRLTFTVDLPSPAVAADEIRISLSGFQGNGCCG